MIVPDVNLLIYAYDSSSPWHRPARAWWSVLLSGDEPVGLPWLVAIAFLRITTHPTLNENPMAPAEVMEIFRDWEECPNFSYLHPGPRHREVLETLFRPGNVSGNRINDAHIAALAIEHHATVHSNDADFARFKGLRWKNPLGK